jgi:hypothetical protein
MGAKKSSKMKNSFQFHYFDFEVERVRDKKHLDGKQTHKQSRSLNGFTSERFGFTRKDNKEKKTSQERGKGKI